MNGGSNRLRPVGCSQRTSTGGPAARHRIRNAVTRVRFLPDGAWFDSHWALLRFRMWGSLASRVPWEHEIVGSNPTILTLYRCGQTVRRRPVKPTSEGSIPSTGASMNGRASQLAMAPRSNRDELHGLEGSTPSPSARKQNVSLAERQWLRSSKPARRVRLPQGTLSGA